MDRRKLNLHRLKQNFNNSEITISNNLTIRLAFFPFNWYPGKKLWLNWE